ncbi:MAG TPA: DUF4139 domain-containing protein [Polyangiaceae bacterium]|jgi:hypothetical protein
MRHLLRASAALALLGGVGCGGSLPARSNVARAEAPSTIGRIVVYRNGVAYFERTAHVPGDTLTLPVPADRVDDLLKSLDVVDAHTGQSAAVAYPTEPKADAAGMIDMQIELTGNHPHDVRLSYVTGAPAWKPSYRVTIGDHERVALAGWAIVDNTSGEDWRNVRLGVGASSALSFRFDLRSVRPVDRETLEPDGLFAQAPPVVTGQPVAPAAAGAPPPPAPATKAHAGAAPMPATPAALLPPSDASSDPIGTSHFESAEAMTVPHGTSAMVSILQTQAEGEVVYLYDPESPRGSAQLAFKSLRLRNPTDSQLEAGPVTVFGEGRLIGEGLSEPIPPKQLAFVPFALDRQVAVDRSETEHDEVAGIAGAQRGVFTTRVQHVRRTTLVVHNRLPERTVVYVRHTVAPGYHASKAPTDPEHAAGADLYRVEVDGFGKQEVVLEEAAPVTRVIDVRTAEGMQLVRAFLATSRDDGLKGRVDHVAALEDAVADVDQRTSALRAAIGEKTRHAEELRAQVASLASMKGVHGGAALAATLQAKEKQLRAEIARATADVAALDEKRLLASIELREGADELAVEGTAPAPPAPSAPASGLARGE